MLETEGQHVGVRDALGESPAFLDFQERLSRVARVERPVLLIGERGTGKELAAARLHFLSKRWEAPLIALNCAALSPSLVESELFGHEAGAFTGARDQRHGRFELAHEGSLFLDEIAVIPIPVQEKILRVVEYGTFERVGGAKPLTTDVRIIGATNVNLKQKVDEGGFKQDLLDRLSFEVLFVPPLRERGEDILLLANHFASRMAHELERTELPAFTTEAESALLKYPWPGNIRELKNVVERAVYRSEADNINAIAFDPFDSPYALRLEQESSPLPRPEEAPEGAGGSFAEQVHDLEVKLVKEALSQTRFNQKRAADLLGLTYHQFRGLYRKHGDQLSRSCPLG